jgi:hypothetical protein
MRVRSTGLLALLVSASAPAAPFLTADQNVLLGGSGLSLPVPAELATGAIRIDLATNWSSTASSGLEADEALLVDVEGRDARLFVEHALSDRYSLRLQVPYRVLTTGVLDGFIDGWHRTLGLPEGARKFLERNQFQIGYLRGGRTILNQRRPIQGIGDVVLEGGYQAWQSEQSSGALWIGVEAPTGSEARLLGNGAWDVGIRFAARQSIGARGEVYWQAGASRPGKGGPLAEWQQDWVVAATASYDFALTPALHAKAQLDAHSASYRSAVDFLGRAVILTVGGSYRFASGLTLDLGIGEDVEVGASPDVNFCFSLRQSF